MRIKLILAILAIICGIGLFATAVYIDKQVSIGRSEIRSGQAKIDAGQAKVNSGQKQVKGAQSGVETTKTIVDNTTQVKGLGGLLTSPVQEQINSGQQQINAGQKKINAGREKIKAGTQQANAYERLAGYLKFGGIALMIVGILLLFLLFKKQR